MNPYGLRCRVHRATLGELPVLVAAGAHEFGVDVDDDRETGWGLSDERTVDEYSVWQLVESQPQASFVVSLPAFALVAEGVENWPNLGIHEVLVQAHDDPPDDDFVDACAKAGVRLSAQYRHLVHAEHWAHPARLAARGYMSIEVHPFPEAADSWRSLGVNGRRRCARYGQAMTLDNLAEWAQVLPLFVGIAYRPETIPDVAVALVARGVAGIALTIGPPSAYCNTTDVQTAEACLQALGG